MTFKFIRLGVQDVISIEPCVFEDERGFFAEIYKLSEFEKMDINYRFVQDNHSMSKRGVLRGLHYQINPKPQGKLIRVIKGKIFDVSVDIRKGSPYYGKWVGVILSGENRHMLWVPPGFAHGFVALEDNTEVLYKTTQEYAPELDRGIIWNDSDIGIDWPVKEPLISPKDERLPSFKDAENNFMYREET
jgi:dTDP-4-dehydrorhamnose 3,5-epimerase